MQFQIPQFIETEDKIVGPFSLRQFLYIGVGAAVSFLLYFTVDTWLWALFSTFIIGAAAALAFVKVNGRALPRLAAAAAGFFWKPRTYVWRAEHPLAMRDEDAVRKASGGRFSLGNIISGLALKTTWQEVQTGTAASKERAERVIERAKERFGVVERITGKRDVAHRVDY